MTLDDILQVNFTGEDLEQLRFDEIVSLMDDGEFTQAKEKLSQIFKEGYLDFRLVAYYFYVCFRDLGLGSLSDICKVLREFIEKHWESITPLNKRDNQVQQSLQRLFTDIHDRLEFIRISYSDVKKKSDYDPKWLLKMREVADGKLDPVKLSVKKLDADLSDTIVDQIKQFRDFIESRWPNSGSVGKLTMIGTWIGGLSVVASEPAPERTDEEKKEARPEPEQPAPIETPIDIPIPSPVQAPKPASNESLPMRLLRKKLKLFSQLIERKSFDKAAIVAEDIFHVLQTSDLTVFMPHLFTDFYAHIARHSSAIDAQKKQDDDPSWLSLKKLYSLDLEAFTVW